MMISFFIFRRPIIAVEGEIWRWSFDPSGFPDLWMEVGSSDGPDKNRVYRLSNTTTRTCGRPVVSQLLGAPNQYRAPNLRSSWPCSNTRLSSPKNTSTYRQLMNNTGSSHREIQATLSELWTASPNSHEHGITEWWYMCASFLAI